VDGIVSNVRLLIVDDDEALCTIALGLCDRTLFAAMS